MARRGRAPAGYVSLKGRGRIVLSNGHVRDNSGAAPKGGTAEFGVMPASATSRERRR